MYTLDSIQQIPGGVGGLGGGTYCPLLGKSQVVHILDVIIMESSQFHIKAQYSKKQYIAMVLMYPINHWYWYSFKSALNDLDRRSYRCSKFKTS